MPTIGTHRETGGGVRFSRDSSEFMRIRWFVRRPAIASI